MKIAFCLITIGDKELESVKKCVESALPAVDTVHITANHEHEETKKWCEEKGHDFTYLPWNDSFSEQRNFNFSRAPEDTDYILWADSDDIIIGADLIKGVAEKAKQMDLEEVFFKYWYSCTFKGEPGLDTVSAVDLEQERERLIRPNAITWKKRLHESPIPKDGVRGKYTTIPYNEDTPILWLHLSSDRFNSVELQEKKMERNRRILELDLKDERENGEADPRTILYLMKIYAESDDRETLNKMFDLGREYLQKSGWDLERAQCCLMMCRGYGKINDHQTAVKYAHRAVEEYPTTPLPYLYLARCYFNLKNFSAMEHWMKVGMSLKLPETSNQIVNLLEIKMLSAELMLQFYLYGKKNIRKAYEAAVLLNNINPTENNQNNVDFLFDQKELDLATENVHKLMNYYESINRHDLIPELCKSVPDEMKELPFIIKKYNKFSEPKIWKDNEICYYATFGGDHFEKWDGNSLKKGIGGSETAVIRLSEEWAKIGYKVTVYCDCGKPKIINGVLYMPYYAFNHRDYFNIFISWRHNSLLQKINARKVLIDLHDVWSDHSYSKRQDSFDYIMVKSEFHKSFGPDVKKYKVISNGI